MIRAAQRDVVRDGVVQGYVLDSYSARKLGLKTTGNADGVHNLFIRSTQAAPSRAELLRTMGTGLLVTELMGLEQPEDGLQSRFSARHGVAVGLLYGRAGLAEFSDAVATAPQVAALRSRITLDADPAVARDAAVLRITRGPASLPPPGSAQAAIEVAVEHARGSAARPLTDDEVLDKARALFGPVLGQAAADRARDAIDELPGAKDTAGLRAVLRPEVGS